MQTGVGKIKPEHKKNGPQPVVPYSDFGKDSGGARAKKAFRRNMTDAMKAEGFKSRKAFRKYLRKERQWEREIQSNAIGG